MVFYYSEVPVSLPRSSLMACVTVTLMMMTVVFASAIMYSLLQVSPAAQLRRICGSTVPLEGFFLCLAALTVAIKSTYQLLNYTRYNKPFNMHFF